MILPLSMAPIIINSPRSIMLGKVPVQPNEAICSYETAPNPRSG